jgi:phage shock protein B
MDGVDYDVLELILISSLVGLLLLGTFFLVAIKMIQGGRKQKRAKLADEARMIQEIYQGMRKMEQRVESLETILFDRDGDGGGA